MKAFLIAFILLATVVFSPLSTCTARELVETGYVFVDLAGTLNPNNATFSCGQGQRYCVPKTPKKACSSIYKRNC
ncbi:hypothetical protein IMY05_C5307000200 [Salix suchowensis]|nr:hypothetical protein IMY05_C5307000200 [Salix suchowensis]